MSLDEGIKHGKEHRKPYHGSKAFDQSCRPGGNCSWCQGNREHADKKRELSAEEEKKDHDRGE